MSRTYLFLINGLGLGNSTRCHAVIEHLVAAGCRIHVMTSGNGLQYFRDVPGIESLSSIDPFYYSGSKGDNSISGWSTLGSLRNLLRIAEQKRRQLDRLLGQIEPDVMVIDSEYVTGPARRRGIPVIALNTSEMVVSEYLRKSRAQRGIRSHFWFVEFSDYLFHRHYCDLVLSPFPVPTPTRHRKFRRTGLIIRRALKQRQQEMTKTAICSPRQLRKVVFMLSGSVHASQIPFESCRPPFQIEVVGRSGESKDNVTFHGRKLDNTELLKAADALVINGGYSAVSEAFLLRKPVFVVPVGGHAEQFINACLVRDFGLGYVATEANVLNQLMQMHAADRWADRPRMPAHFELNGDEEAAEAILSFPPRMPQQQKILIGGRQTAFK